MSCRVVVVGGGVAALELVLALHELAGDRVTVEVVTPEREFVYRPLAVAEPFGLATARHFSLDRILADYGAVRRPAIVKSVVADRGVVTTATDAELQYDALVVATGARTFEAIPGALTVASGDGFARLGTALKNLVPDDRLVIAVPAGGSWTLPAYELALMAKVAHPSLPVAIVTPEATPLAVFGQNASRAVAELLAERQIGFYPESHALAVESGGLARVGAPAVEASIVVALPGLRGRSLTGLPHDSAGFIPVDSQCRVTGLRDVFAAGDVTTFPVKQGGIAAQQAVVVAKTIAEKVGIPVAPAQFEPVLRGLLITGGLPEYLKADIARGMGVHHSEAGLEPIWWPPNKIATEHLSQLLTLIAAAEPLPSEDPFLRIETDDVGHLLRNA